MVSILQSHGLTSRSALVLKLVALAAMTVDHVDWLLLDGALGFHATWGRVVFPLFAYVLGANAMRAEPSHLLRRVVPRLLVVGAVSQLAYGALTNWSTPLNVLFTLALSLAVIAWWEQGRKFRAVWAFLVLGLLVDYQWWGVLCVVAAAWSHVDRRVPLWALGITWAALLYPINGNLWALAALPVIVAVAQIQRTDAPRWKWLFYGYYPLHLFALVLIAR